MEKRKQMRWAKRIEVRFGIDRPSQLGFVIDLSEAGLFLKTTTVYPSQTPLVLEMYLPDKQVLSLRGYVTWTKRLPPQLARHLKKAGMGVELTDPSPKYLAFVRGLSPAVV